mgnify:CR=1 FL=1
MSDFLYDLCGKPFGWIMRLIYDLVDNYAFGDPVVHDLHQADPVSHFV